MRWWKNPFKYVWEVIKFPFIMFAHKRRLRRLIYALSKLQHPEVMPDETERAVHIETIQWLIKYYKGDADANAQGTPEMKLDKILKTPVKQFTNLNVIESRILSHWIQYEHIDGF